MPDALSMVRLEPGSGLGLSEQLRSQVALLIADGRLRPGDALPAVRTLAAQLGVSVNTVRAAYARLESDGAVRTRQGLGTTVVESPPGGLRTGSAHFGSNVVAVLIAGLDPFYLPLLRGVEEVADERGMLVVVADTQDSAERASAVIRRLVARGVDGLVVVSMGGPDRASLDERTKGPPVVFVDQPGAKGPSFVFDAERGARLATAHLLDHGHERIGMITAPRGWSNVAPLVEGHLAALRERGVEPRPDRIVEVAAFRLEEGRLGLSRLLEGPDPPSAVFATGAELALGVMDEGRRLGMRIPDELAVVGYTDVESAALVEPPVTMVSVPAREIGVRAMTALARLIAGERVSAREIVLDVELVVRASCGRH